MLSTHASVTESQTIYHITQPMCMQLTEPASAPELNASKKCSVSFPVCRSQRDLHISYMNQYIPATTVDLSIFCMLLFNMQQVNWWRQCLHCENIKTYI